LEDDSGRMACDFSAIIDAHQLVTGISMAALGYEGSNGVFVVKDVCFAGMSTVPPFPNNSTRI